MAIQKLAVAEIGDVHITRKKGMKSIRLRIGANNEILVSAPRIVSKRQIESFVRQKSDWIKTHQSNPITKFYDGMGLGINGVLEISSEAGPSKMLVRANGVHARLAVGTSSEEVKDKITTAIIKYLASETEAYVFPRVLSLADLYGYKFNQLKVKKLKGRWASCDEHKNVTLSVYLVQLEPNIVDYVILHELAHTKHMNHSREFWDEVQRVCPEYKLLRKSLKKLQPRLYDRFDSNAF